MFFFGDVFLASPASEIRLGGPWGRDAVFFEVVGVVLVARRFIERPAVDAPPALRRRPRRREGAGIVDRHGYLHDLAAFDELEAFDDVELAGVRRAVIVDEGPVGDA